MDKRIQIRISTILLRGRDADHEDACPNSHNRNSVHTWVTCLGRLVGQLELQND